MAETLSAETLAELAPRITTRDWFDRESGTWPRVAAAWREASAEQRAEFLRAVPHVASGLVTREAVNPEARTVELAFSSEEPYARWWGTETLSHAPDACDLARLNAGGAGLVEHDRYDHVATVVPGSARIESGRGRALLRFGNSQRAQEVFNDIKDGIRSLVSVGYSIDSMVLTRVDNTTGEDFYTVDKWTPFEISIVAIPADPTVGVGRSAFQKPPAGPAPHVPAARNTMEKTMTTDVIDPPAPAAQARQAETAPNPKDIMAAERARIKEIDALGKRFNLGADAERAIEGGMAVEAFKALIADRAAASGSPLFRPAESAEIGMSERDMQQFSFCRALLAAQNPANARELAPFEYECSVAAKDRLQKTGEREAGITIPLDMLHANLRAPATVAARAVQEVMQRHRLSAAFRDLVVGTPAAGGNTVATEVWGTSFIELLRSATILSSMGVRWLRDLNGNVAIPRQSGAASTFWVAENNAPTESQQTVDQVTLSPKTVGAYTDYSRRLTMQSSIDVETFVRMDLAAIIALAIEIAAIAGTGASNQPLGILNISGIGAVVGGTNGLAPTYDNIVDLETQVANANAAAGSLAYLTNTKVRGKLRRTQEFGGTNGKAIWTGGGLNGEVLGYNAFVTNTVPSNLDKGTSTGVCSAAIFGNWSELLIGMWGGLDLLMDPYTGSTAGTKRLVALQDCDVNVRHPASFAAMKDALTV